MLVYTCNIKFMLNNWLYIYTVHTPTSFEWILKYTFMKIENKNFKNIAIKKS